jgi:nitrilase
MEKTIVAAVQAAPVFLDRDATVDKACALIAEAAAQGAGLVAFPEAFVPGYPDWVWRTPAWHDGEFAQRLYAGAIEIGSPAAGRLADAAAGSGVYVAIGVNELDGGTLYNTLLYFAPDGTLVARHRKLMPTGGERTIWGMGDGSTLGVVRTPFGVVGGLICWENYMPLARAAMYAQGVTIYLARPGTTVRSGCRRCGTSPRRAASTYWAWRPCSTAGTFRRNCGAICTPAPGTG